MRREPEFQPNCCFYAGRWIARVSTWALFALSVAVASGPAYSNIVVNGGFETGDFTGYFQTGNTGFNGVQCPGPVSVAEGNCDAFFGPVGSEMRLSQDLSTVAGSTYEIKFQLDTDGGTPSSFSAFFGGFTLVTLRNPPNSPGFLAFDFFATATGSTTLLAFNFRDDPGFLVLDAVSVVRVTPTSVPEPGTLALAGISLAGLGFTRRRLSKRSKSGR